MKTRRILAAVTGAGLLTTGLMAMPSQAATKAVSLKGICPNPIVAQTDWFPEVDHNELYVLSAPGGKIEKAKYTAPLIDPRTKKATGVSIEIRKGGPAVGFQPVTALMYQDPKIFMGYTGTNESIQFSADKPTINVVAPRDKSPQIIMWDPATYPKVKTIADLKATGAKVRYFDSATYMEYLISKGILDAKQVDGSYDGRPANFVADGGKAAQQGFATSEPYFYENELAEWKKPVAYQLIADTGYDIYPESLAVTPATMKKYDKCLKALVPMIQAAQVAYQADSAATEALIVKVVKEQNDGWAYTAGQAAAATKASFKDGIISNGSDKIVGNFDMKRIQGTIDIFGPIFSKKNAPIKAGLKPTDVATNKYIDPKIGLK